jgi:uncharacterized LabA/DUF88 family protein
LAAPNNRAGALWDWMADDVNGTAVLDFLYPERALVSLATRIGLSYPGHRIEKIPRTELLAAIRETLQADPRERSRVLEEVIAAAQPQREEVARLQPADVRRWLGAADEAGTLSRLIAAIAFGSPGVVRAAERWWRRSLADAAERWAADAENAQDLAGVADALEKTRRPLAAAASVLEDILAQLRGLGRTLQQEEQRRTQVLNRHGTDLAKSQETIMRELARLQSWAGEQHGALRTAVGELAGRIHSLEARIDRFEAAVRGLAGRAAEAGVALERGQAARARRQLARLRGGAARVGIFVDAVNLSASARESYASGVRYAALREHGGRLGEVTIARAYATEHPLPEKQAALDTALRRSGFDVRTLPLRQLPDGRLKANWDLGMATDVMRHAADLDVVLLCTGDGDFVELVRWLREEGLQVQVAGIAGHTAGELIASADGWIPLGEEARLPAREHGVPASERPARL